MKMARAASVFRWIILAIWTVLLVPFISRAWNGVLDRGDVANHPFDWAMSVLASVAQYPGVLRAALIATGLAAGVWIDWVFRKLDGSREASRVDLGVNLTVLARQVSDRQNGFHSDWPGNINDLKPRLLSVYIKLQKMGIWAPGERLQGRFDGARILSDYLSMVGTLLRERHFSQAKEKANGLKEFLDRKA
jgi:hypothetical protein